MLVSGKQMLEHAHKHGYAVGAFNINNMEILQALVAAAEEERSPVLLQVSEGAIKYAGMDYLSAMVKVAASKTDIPICLHLDHGTTYETIMQCMTHGWTSVMYDGSHHPLETNIAETAHIVKVAHASGISVEAELGRLSGTEDNISVAEKDSIYTNPQEAEKFVRETGIDSLAIAIGTAHGKYKGEPKLDYERLDTIKKMLNMPIVLHGASGLTEEQLKKCVSLGVNKINIDTDFRQAFTDGIHSAFDADPDVFDPRKILSPAREAVKQVAIKKIRMFGSSGMADVK